MNGLEMLCLMVGALAAIMLLGLAIGAFFAAIAAPFALLFSWVF